MNEAAAQQMRRIISSYGPGICDDPRRVEALLRDLSGEPSCACALSVPGFATHVGGARAWPRPIIRLPLEVPP